MPVPDCLLKQKLANDGSFRCVCLWNKREISPYGVYEILYISFILNPYPLSGISECILSFQKGVGRRIAEHDFPVAVLEKENLIPSFDVKLTSYFNRNRNLSILRYSGEIHCFLHFSLYLKYSLDLWILYNTVEEKRRSILNLND